VSGVSNQDGAAPLGAGRSAPGAGLPTAPTAATAGLPTQQDTSQTPPAERAPDYFAHPSAFINDAVEIGKGTKIWHVSHIMKGSRIGNNCNVGQNVVIGPNATIGDGVKIQNNVSVYEGVILEDDVFCGPSMVFTNVYNPRSEIRRMGELRPTVVGRGATLGANCTIVCGHTIGEYAFVAAGAVVTRDVPPYALVAGVPAKQIGWICRCADQRLHLAPDEAAQCTACGRRYRLQEGRVLEELEAASELSTTGATVPRKPR
jgi:UDP-2-acetamido-3-amino-2,3-dideoxy-glucuronate N-acetyltransferase